MQRTGDIDLSANTPNTGPTLDASGKPTDPAWRIDPGAGYVRYETPIERHAREQAADSAAAAADTAAHYDRTGLAVVRGLHAAGNVTANLFDRAVENTGRIVAPLDRAVGATHEAGQLESAAEWAKANRESPNDEDKLGRFGTGVGNAMLGVAQAAAHGLRDLKHIDASTAGPNTLPAVYAKALGTLWDKPLAPAEAGLQSARQQLMAETPVRSGGELAAMMVGGMAGTMIPYVLAGGAGGAAAKADPAAGIAARIAAKAKTIGLAEAKVAPINVALATDKETSQTEAFAQWASALGAQYRSPTLQKVGAWLGQRANSEPQRIATDLALFAGLSVAGEAALGAPGAIKAVARDPSLITDAVSSAAAGTRDALANVPGALARGGQAVARAGTGAFTKTADTLFGPSGEKVAADAYAARLAAIRRAGTDGLPEVRPKAVGDTAPNAPSVHRLGDLDNDPRVGQPGYQVNRQDGHVVEILRTPDAFAGERYAEGAAPLPVTVARVGDPKSAPFREDRTASQIADAHYGRGEELPDPEGLHEAVAAGVQRVLAADPEAAKLMTPRDIERLGAQVRSKLTGIPEVPIRPAIRTESGLQVDGATHVEALDNLVKAPGVTPEVLAGSEEGYLTNMRRFVNRDEAESLLGLNGNGDGTATATKGPTVTNIGDLPAPLIRAMADGWSSQGVAGLAKLFARAQAPKAAASGVGSAAAQAAGPLALGAMLPVAMAPSSGAEGDADKKRMLWAFGLLGIIGAMAHDDAVNPGQLLRAAKLRRISNVAVRLLGEDEGGFTINPWTGERLTQGYAVGLGSRGGHEVITSDFSPASVKEALQQNLHIFSDPSVALGAWKHPETGKLHVEPVRIHRTVGLAVEDGLRGQQEAIGSLAHYARGEDGTISLAPGQLPPTTLVPRRNTLAVAQEFGGGTPPNFRPKGAVDAAVRQVGDAAWADTKAAFARFGGSAEWYRRSVAEMMDHARAESPDLADPANEGVFKAILAVTSNNEGVETNYSNTIEVWKERGTHGLSFFDRSQGDVPTEIAKNGAPRYLGNLRENISGNKTVNVVERKLQMLDQLVRERGAQGAVGHLMSTVGEGPSAHYVAEDLLGPKQGAFFLNMMGVSDIATVDRWALRTWYRWSRYLRTSADANTGVVGLTSVPTDTERRAIGQTFRAMADRLSAETGQRIDVMDVQAMLWDYEQDLFARAGARETSGGGTFAEAARTHYTAVTGEHSLPSAAERDLAPGADAGGRTGQPGGGEGLLDQLRPDGEGPRGVAERPAAPGYRPAGAEDASVRPDAAEAGAARGAAAPGAPGHPDREAEVEFVDRPVVRGRSGKIYAAANAAEGHIHALGAANLAYDAEPRGAAAGLGSPEIDKAQRQRWWDSQGFSTNKREFVSRAEALEIAHRAGQIPTAMYEELKADQPFVGLGSHDLFHAQAEARRAPERVTSSSIPGYRPASAADASVRPDAAAAGAERGAAAPGAAGDTDREAEVETFTLDDGRRIPLARSVSAATMLPDGTVATGPIHNVAHANATAFGKLPPKPLAAPSNWIESVGGKDGFVTANGDFVTRDEAERLTDQLEGVSGGRDTYGRALTGAPDNLHDLVAAKYGDYTKPVSRGQAREPSAAPAYQRETLGLPAIETRDGRRFEGPMHILALQKAQDVGALPRDVTGKEYKVGWMTSTGRFVSRAEATRMQQAAGGRVGIDRATGKPRLDAHDMISPQQAQRIKARELRETEISPEALAAWRRRMQQLSTQHATIAHGSEDAASAAADRILQSPSAKFATASYNMTLGSADRIANIRTAKGKRAAVDIPGHFMDGPDDAHALMLPFRDPQQEHFHVMLADDPGNLLGHTVETSGDISQVSLAKSDPAMTQWLDRIADRAKRAGATKVYFGHNHPSGVTTPSQADIQLTATAAHYLQTHHGLELAGHYIIDHMEGMWLTPHWEPGMHARGTLTGLDGYEHHLPGGMDVPDYTQVAVSLDDVRKVGELATQFKGKRPVTILYADAQGRAVAAEPHRVEALDRMDKWIDQRMKAHGAAQAILVTDRAADPTAYERAIAGVKAARAANPSSRAHNVADVIDMGPIDPGAPRTPGTMISRRQGTSYQSALWDQTLPVSERADNTPAARRYREAPVAPDYQRPGQRDDDELAALGAKLRAQRARLAGMGREKIAAPAVRGQSGQLYAPGPGTRLDGNFVERPQTHISAMARARAAGDAVPTRSSKEFMQSQGFATTSGRFVGRDEALEIAYGAKQISPKQYREIRDLYEGALGSEDIPVSKLGTVPPGMLKEPTEAPGYQRAQRGERLTDEDLQALLADVRTRTAGRRPLPDAPATAPEAAAARQPASMVRLYHGGSDYSGGPRWLTPDRAYAEGYAKKSGGTLQYVDVPSDHPLLEKAFDDTGTDTTAPVLPFEAPETIAQGLKPVEAAPSTAPEVTSLPAPRRAATGVGASLRQVAGSAVAGGVAGALTGEPEDEGKRFLAGATLGAIGAALLSRYGRAGAGEIARAEEGGLEGALGRSVAPSAIAAAPAAAAEAAPAEAVASIGAGAPEQAPRAVPDTKPGYLNYPKFGGDSVLAKTVQARIATRVEELRAAGDVDKGYQSFATQDAKRQAFARKLVADPLAIDQSKLKKLDGYQIGALRDVVAENTAIIEAASRAIDEGSLTGEPLEQALKTIDTAQASTDEALGAIVRETARLARGLGYLRQVAHLTTEPEYWLLQAKKMVGADAVLSDELQAQVRRLAREAGEACAGAAA